MEENYLITIESKKIIGNCKNCNNTINNNPYYYKDSLFCNKKHCDDYYRDKIKDGSFKPTPNLFKINTNSKLFMGFELEVEDSEKTVGLKSSQFLDFLEKEKLDKYFYIKDDCSLNYGFELVSHPCTLQFTNKYLKIKKILSYLKKNKFKSETMENCGLHIHLSKDFFSSLDLIKMRIFFSNYMNELFYFSKRKDKYNSYCKYEEKLSLKDFLNNESQIDRYFALNFNTNQKTIEMRLFQGTLKYNDFISFLEFADGLSHFVKTKSINNFTNEIKKGYRNMWSELIKFLSKNKKYSNVYKSLIK